MPHFQIDYSGNLEGEVDMAGLCEAIRATAASLPTFPTPGIRVRALRVDHYAIADGDAAHAFIDISIRLRAGRSEPVKKEATAEIFGAAKDFLAPALAHRSLASRARGRGIDPSLSPKTGTIRDHLKAPDGEP